MAETRLSFRRSLYAERETFQRVHENQHYLVKLSEFSEIFRELEM